jgi:hypothetical protein
MKNIGLIIFFIIFGIVISLLILSSPNLFFTAYEKYYAGDVRHFRANLNEAEKIPVYPNEETIKNVLLNPEVFKIYIAFFPDETENSYYFASSFEVTNKLAIIFRHILGEDVQTFKDVDESSCLVFYPDKQIRCFKSFPINSTDELIPSFVEPVILLLGPSHANKTAVTVYNFMIILEGKSFEEVDRTYTDLDLAVDKMLLVLMD